MTKKKFLEEYHLEEIFSKAYEKGLTWTRLMSIYRDYKNNYLPYYEQKAQEVVELLREKAPSEAANIYGRAKHPEHLREKIIRKVGKEGGNLCF